VRLTKNAPGIYLLSGVFMAIRGRTGSQVEGFGGVVPYEKKAEAAKKASLGVARYEAYFSA
jgi:hypothetical protein